VNTNHEIIFEEFKSTVCVIPTDVTDRRTDDLWQYRALRSIVR